MMTKKGVVVITLVVMLILCINIVEARQTIITKADEFRIDFVKYDPSPLVPGQSSDLWFEISNLKGLPLGSFQISLVDKYPFTGEGITTINVPELMPAETLPFKFTVKPDPNAPAGTYSVYLQYYSEKVGMINSEVVSLNLQNTPKILTVTDIKRTPDTAVPGGNVVVKFLLTNTYASQLKDIAIKLDMVNATYFAPATTTSEANLKALDTGATQEISFNLLVSPNAPADVYKIPVVITFTDDAGNAVTKNTYIGIPVNSVPVYSLYLEDSTVFEKDTPGKVVLSVSNVGPVDIKYLTIRVLDSNAYDIVSKSQVYVGNLKPDDYQTAEFKLFRKKEGPLRLMLTYKDAYSMEYSKVEDIPLPLFSESQATKYGLTTPTSYIGTILLMIIIALGVWIVYEWITHKNLKKAVNYVLFGSIVTIIDFIMFFRPKNIKQRYKEVVDHIKGEPK